MGDKSLNFFNHILFKNLSPLVRLFFSSNNMQELDNIIENLARKKRERNLIHIGRAIRLNYTP